MKKCSKCGIEKNLNEFHKNIKHSFGVSNKCKKCVQEYDKLYYDKNKNKILKNKKIYHKNNQDYILEYKKQYYSKNKDCIINRSKTFYSKNKTKINQTRYELRRQKNQPKLPTVPPSKQEIRNRINKRRKYRWDNDIQYKTKELLRGRLRKMLNGQCKTISAIEDLGCSIEYLLEYLKTNLRRELTKDDNIDHIIPAHLIDFTDRRQLLIFCNYKNLRYINKIDNIKRDYTDILDNEQIIELINEFIPMFPPEVPVFTKDMILIDPNNYESDDGRKTTVGWLKELFLYNYIDKENLKIEQEDRKIFQIVLDKFRKCAIIKKDQDIHQWEDEQTPAHQARMLNKLCRSLGYTIIEEV